MNPVFPSPYRLSLLMVLWCPSLLALAGQSLPAPTGVFSFAESGKFEGKTESANWCAEVAAIKIKAIESPSIFNPNPPDEFFLKNGVRAPAGMMKSFCPQLNKITINGWYKGELYYAGAAESKDGWQLRGIYAEP